jgi:hypothetical protein
MLGVRILCTSVVQYYLFELCLNFNYALDCTLSLQLLIVPVAVSGDIPVLNVVCTPAAHDRRTVGTRSEWYIPVTTVRRHTRRLVSEGRRTVAQWP